MNDPCVEIAHILRNDISVIKGLLHDTDQAFARAIHRCQGTMDGLQALIDNARAERTLPRLIDPAGTFTIRTDRAGNGAFGAPRGRHTHRGIDTPCTPGDSVRAPVEGVFKRIGWCYPPAVDARFQLVVIENGNAQVRVLYVDPAEGLVGTHVLQGQHIGRAQDITDKQGDDGLYRDQGMTPHLHTECYIGGDLMDPAPLMRIT